LIRGGYIEGRAGYDHHHAGKLILQRVKLGIAPRSILLHKATNTGIGHQEEQRKKSGNDNARDNRDYTTHNGCSRDGAEKLLEFIAPLTTRYAILGTMNCCVILPIRNEI
jgi:hypothetical protein